MILPPTELLIGLLERDGAVVTADDFAGPAGRLLRAASAAGFLSRDPVAHPSPGCPYCEGGVPRSVGGRLLCTECRCEVAGVRLWCRAFGREAFLAWLSAQWGLQGERVRRVDPALWHLGTWSNGDRRVACFYQNPKSATAAGLARVSAHRSALLLGGLTLSPRPPGGDGGVRRLALVDLVHWDEQGGTLGVAPLGDTREDRRVRFDAATGGLWAGAELLGEVPVGSREYHFLRSLAANLDRFVCYADIRHEVRRHSGSADASGEAAFCHALKRRIKKHWVADIDRVLVTTNKGDGYRMRGWLAP